MIRDRINYWFPVAQKMAEFINDKFRKEDEAKPKSRVTKCKHIHEECPVYVGSKGAARKFPCVEIVWANEYGINLPSPTSGEIELWIYVCVKGDNSDPSDAYKMQDELQQRVLRCLQGRELPLAIGTVTGTVANAISIDSINSDYEQNRPVMLARIKVIIDWKQS